MPHEVVRALFLPKWTSRQGQHCVSASGRDAFQRSRHFGQCHGGSSEQMKVIWHDYEGMQLIVPEDIGVVVDGFHNHIRDGRLAEVDRSIAGFVQQSIHSGKFPSGWSISWECGNRR